MRAAIRTALHASRLFVLALIFAAALSPRPARAQSSTTTARTPGAPAGSYKLGDADTINLFTGNLNYNLPLLGVGGRGEAQTALGIVIEGQWDMREYEPVAPQGFLQHEYSFRYPDPLALVGSVRLDASFVASNDSCGGGGNWTTWRVNMTYVEPDGTEHALRDRVRHAMQVQTCGVGQANFGNVFESTGGDFVTFVTDTQIWTDCFGVSGCTNAVDGYLFFRNGSKARVVGGRIQWQHDRNGNKLTYEYETNPHDLNAQRLKKITDAVGREIFIYYSLNEGGLYGRHDKIVYKGFGGLDKVIRISRETDLLSLLRTTQPYDATTPVEIEDNDPNDSILLSFSGSMPDYVKAVWLPDNRRYEFKYNILGQLARIELPTGGAVEYDYADIFQIPFEALPGALGPVTNRVSEKRTYGSNNTLLGRMAFSVPTSFTPGVLPPSRGGVVRDTELFDPHGNRLSKTRHYFYGSPNTDYGLLVPWWHGKELRTETFDTNGTTMLRVTESDWRQRVPSWCASVWPCSSNPAEVAPSNNPFVVETRSTLVDGNLVAKVSGVHPTNGTYAFDAYNNQTHIWQYDYGVGQPGPLLKHTQISYINNVTSLGSIYLFTLTDTTSDFAVGPGGVETLAASTQTLYDEYSLYPLLTYGTVSGWQDPASVRGNPTTVKRWLNTNNSWVDTHAQFDQLGNVRRSWDALGRMSETFYNDTFTDGLNHNTFAYPTQTVSAVPDGSNVHGSNAAFVASSVFDYHSGLLQAATDINGQTTTLEYNDPLDRLKKVNNPPGGGWTSYDYQDAPGNLYVKTTTAFDDARNLESYTYFDALGRAARSFTSKAGGLWVVGDTVYDAAGRVSKISKPYETSQTPSPGNNVNPADNWVNTSYDALGRVTKVTTADGSETATSYIGNTATVTDASLRKRKTESDALGHLKQVVEDPGGADLITNYKFDVLGNLRAVDQGPPDQPQQQQHRYYAYDSLSRLVRSRNPEEDANASLALTDLNGNPVNDPVSGNGQWSTRMDYLANGDLSARTDARGIKVEFFYDDVNRPYLRTYTATQETPTGTYTPTPSVEFFYDGRGLGLSTPPANTAGRLTRVLSSVSETRYTAFDAMGRVKSSEQTVGGQTYLMPLYNYNLAGMLVSQTYPSGRVVQNAYDDGGKLSAVGGELSGQAAKAYASDFDHTYTNGGATSRMKLGNGRWESAAYNKRLQPVLLALGTTQGGSDLLKLEYDFGATDNNGNVHSQTVTVPNVNPGGSPSNAFTAVQTYGYDALNRLTSAVEATGGQTAWRQTFTYDRFGNRSVVTNGPEATTPAMVGEDPAVSASSNRITPRAGESYDFDKAGNLVRDRVGNAYSYDGDSRQAAFTSAGAGQAAGQFFYDGAGRRVKKVFGGETTVFVYNMLGQLVAEYASNVQPTSEPTKFLTADPLGSPRINTGQAGNVVARHDYEPFGGEVGAFGGRAGHGEYRADNVRQKFAGYERDENGLDFAQARYYASGAGRFTSVDPLMASASTTSPQTYNRYTYALNNPYRYTDPTGMDTEGLDEVNSAFAHLGELADNAYYAELARKEAQKEAERKKQQQQQQPPPQQQRQNPNAPQGGKGGKTGVGQKPQDQPSPSPPPPAGNGDMAGQGEAIVGNTDYAPSGTVGDYGAGTNKCNIFVFNMATEAGINLPMLGGNFGRLRNTLGINKNPPSASDWANPSIAIEGFEVIVGSPAQRNDIISDGVHVGIAAGNDQTVSAAFNGVVKNDWGFRENQTVVIRRRNPPPEITYKTSNASTPRVNARTGQPVEQR